MSRERWLTAVVQEDIVLHVVLTVLMVALASGAWAVANAITSSRARTAAA